MAVKAAPRPLTTAIMIGTAASLYERQYENAERRPELGGGRGEASGRSSNAGREQFRR